MTLTFFNVGYGEAALLQCPDPSRPDGVFTALIDGGGAEASEFADRSSGRIPVQEYLAAHPARIDLMVSTHTHEDHICGLPEAAWQAATDACVPAKFLELNKKAFALGRNA